MLSPPRYYLISARLFDGTTRPTVPPEVWSPNGPDGNAPRQYKSDQDQIGRFSFTDLIRRGHKGALVQARTYSVATPAVMRVRSVAANETADSPAPFIVDAPLQEVALTTEWSDWVHVGPTDAIALEQTPVGEVPAAVIELCVQDVEEETSLAAWTVARSQQCCDEADVDPSVFTGNDPIPLLADTDTEIASISIPPGTWLIRWNLESLTLDAGASLDAWIEDASASTDISVDAAAADVVGVSLGGEVRVTIVATTEYELRAQANDGAGTVRRGLITYHPSTV